LQNRIDLAKLEIEGQSKELSEAGVDVEQLTKDRISDITKEFGLEQLEIEQRNREALAEIQFKRGVESVKRTKEFEEQKLQIALDIAKKRLAILEATDGTEVAELNEARAAIAGIQSELNKLGATPNVLSKILGFDEGDSFEDKLRKSVDSISDYAGQGLDIINSLAQSSFQSALGSIDRQIEVAMSSIDRLTQEQNSLDGEIENASASQIAALEERRRSNELALAEEQQSLVDLEAEKERIRMEEFEREKKLARERILLESAVQLFKALASLKKKNEVFFENHLDSFLKSYGKMKIEDAIWLGLVHPDRMRRFIVCNFIKRKMLSSDLAVCEIQKRAAARYDMCLRTVQKMWKEYLKYGQTIKT